MTTALAPCPPGVDPDVWAGLCARVREDCEWHISPSVTETVVVAGSANTHIVLDTMHLTAVNSASIDGVLVADPVRFTEWGTVYLPPSIYWPPSWSGVYADVTLSITHGYATCPEGLLQALTAAARSAAPLGVPSGRLQAGPFSAEFDDDLPTRLVNEINRYALPGRA